MNKTQNDKVWAWIKHRLEIQGLNFNKLAARYDVHRTCFTGLKTKPCPKFEAILASHLGLFAWDLWPDRYDEAHNPNRVSSRYQGHKAFLKQGSAESNKNIPGEKQNDKG